MESCLRECRAIQRAGWESDDSLFQPAVDAAIRLANVYRAVGDAKSLFAAKSYLRVMLKKTQVQEISYGFLSNC